MKSVVMIAYNFPPDGSAGSYRPLRFVQHLPALNWKPSVVSLAGANLQRYDPGLLSLVPKETEIVRVPQRDPWQSLQARRERLLKKRSEGARVIGPSADRPTQEIALRSRAREFVRRVESWCYHPDMAMGWIRPALKATLNLCAKKCPDVIYATGGPWSSFLVAQRASCQTGIPYVLDFRDSWTIAYNDFDALRPAWAKRHDSRTLHNLLLKARAVILRYRSEAECYWRVYQAALDASRIHIIPNGYSGEPNKFVSPEADRCTILYAGTLSSYRYDTLLQAIQLLKKIDSGRATRLRFVFVGDGMETLAREALTAGISDMIETHGTVPYAEVARLQQNAHAVLLLGVKPVKGYELCGSKVFSYLQANRPIVGIVSPADEMRKILNRVGISTVADPESLCEIVAVLRRVIDASSIGSLPSLLPKQDACQIYSAETQTAALIRALEGVSAAEPFIPGSVELPPSLREEIGQGNWVHNVHPSWRDENPS